ncbi:MAG: helix-turn-helix domain-containing protein [Candidatus Peribacteraceae bacterium]|nr:helix-turn-helix domain-containing protein [Candidatus Peribacteraceae bacterium]MDD5739965.1 helix-turn-helix domain-containing protein [Candidatus Peribacteraceae bacterium]
MRRKLQHLLSLAGLKDEEVTLYLHLLKLRRASMTELIAESGLNIMTAYRTIKRLTERGLVQAFSINQKQSVYAPLTLKALIHKLDQEQRSLRKVQLALQDLDHLLPFADLTRDADGKTEHEPVELREGLDAFREEYLKIPDLCDDEFLCMGSMQNYWDVAGMSDEASEELAFRHKRFSRNMFCRVFNTHSPESETFAKRDSKELRTTRLVDTIPVARNYLGYTKDHVRHFICDRGNPRVIIIRHPELVALYRDQFERMWSNGVGA